MRSDDIQHLESRLALSMHRKREMIGKLREDLWQIAFRELRLQSPRPGLDDRGDRSRPGPE